MCSLWDLQQDRFCFTADNLEFPQNYLKKRMISSTWGPVVTCVKPDSGGNLKLSFGCPKRSEKSWNWFDKTCSVLTVCDVTNVQFILRCDGPVAVFEERTDCQLDRTSLTDVHTLPVHKTKPDYHSKGNYCNKMEFKFMLNPLFPVGSASFCAPQIIC